MRGHAGQRAASWRHGMRRRSERSQWRYLPPVVTEQDDGRVVCKTAGVQLCQHAAHLHAVLHGRVARGWYAAHPRTHARAGPGVARHDK